MKIFGVSYRRIHELIYPWAWALGAAWAAFSLKLPLSQQVASTQLSTSSTLASILMGFLGTGYGILLSTNSKRLEWAKGHDQIWPAILSFFKVALYANLFLCIFSVGLSSTPLALFPAYLIERVFTPLWAFLLLLSILSFFRAIRILLSLLQRDSTRASSTQTR